MSEQRPEWYGQLKDTDPFAKRTFTMNHITSIEQRIAQQNKLGSRDRRRSMLALAVVTACAVIMVGVIFNLTNIHTVKEPIQTQPPEATPNDQKIDYADEKWKLTETQYLQYAQYAETKSEALLIGLEPIDIFRWYVTASRMGHHETTYALLDKGAGTSTPSREEYLSELAKDQAGVERSKQMWESYWSEYRLEQTIDGDTAYILMIPVHKPDTAENRKFFGLTKNKEGVWKANWLAMQ